MARLAEIRRHPIKGIGSETIGEARLTPDGALAGDRAWALLTEAGEDSAAWQPRRCFAQVASGPALAAVQASVEGAGIRLMHAGRDDLTFDPARGAGPLLSWLGDLWPDDRPAPVRLVRAPGHGMTDMPDPFVSLGNLASLRALSQRAGRPLDLRRFRINLWVEGWAPWEEGDRIGGTVTIGPITLHVAEPIGRCRATEADPQSGRRDVNTLRLLEQATGTTDFGIYARVAAPGTVRLGDAVI